MTVQDRPLLDVGLRRFEGQKFRLPARAADRPAMAYLEQRWESFRRAS